MTKLENSIITKKKRHLYFKGQKNILVNVIFETCYIFETLLMTNLRAVTSLAVGILKTMFTDLIKTVTIYNEKLNIYKKDIFLSLLA